MYGPQKTCWPDWCPKVFWQCAEPAAAGQQSAPQHKPETDVLAQGNANLPPPVSADRFDGQRSLATARMYLFDMTERLFARRTPELAEAIRNDLREARDVDAMLEVAHRLLHVPLRKLLAVSAQAPSVNVLRSYYQRTPWSFIDSNKMTFCKREYHLLRPQVIPD
jgi:hypothetical protein